jgi:hypothetical protein
MQRSVLPPEIINMQPAFSRWLKRRVESAAKPTRQVTLEIAVKNTQVRVRHRLPRVPSGFRLLGQDIAGNLTTPKAPDRYYIYLQSSANAHTVTIEIS